MYSPVSSDSCIKKQRIVCTNLWEFESLQSKAINDWTEKKPNYEQPMYRLEMGLFTFQYISQMKGLIKKNKGPDTPYGEG